MLVLVVDDEESLCELLAEVLAGDYEVIKAYNGKTAYELAKAKMPDVIISDVMMPHMSGVELLKALRNNPETAHIPVILLSAAPLKARITEASAFLSKPFEIEVLENVVAKVAHENNQDGETERLPAEALLTVSPMDLPPHKPNPSIYWEINNS